MSDTSSLSLSIFPPVCSIVIPAFNEEENLERISKKIVDTLIDNNINNYEILFIDDGSTDRTLSILEELHQNNQKIKFLSFSRNFGHQAALKAALDNANGDCVISLDCDLQHPPEFIPEMIGKWKNEGYDIVYTIRKDNKKSPFFKRISSRFFYRLLNYFSEITVEPGSADFRLLDRKVIDVIRQFHESPLFFRGIVPWVGFKQCSIEYVPRERYKGASKYSLIKMLNFALNGIISFSIKPLFFSIYIGILISLLSFCYGIYAVIQKMFFNKTISGWTSLITTILLIGGIQLIILGIIGIYLGKLFMESKKRPPYIIQKKSDEYKH